MYFGLVKVFPQGSEVPAEDKFSSVWDLSYGVPQGSFLTPMLFSIHVKNQEELFMALDLGVINVTLKC